MKDRFSSISQSYQRFRPVYPAELITYLCSLIPNKERAWDCGTGNGQVAVQLARVFREVEATDLSETQLRSAPQLPNLHYRVAKAEETVFPDKYFDLITVAQAIHWFNFDLFYKEVKRCLKPGGLLVVMGYGLIQVNPTIDAVIQKLYSGILGKYWDAERRYIDEGYQTIPFPLRELASPTFTMTYQWTLATLRGYLSTWSAVTLYREKMQQDPLDLIWPELQEVWIHPEETVTFKVLLRIGSFNASTM